MASHSDTPLSPSLALPFRQRHLHGVGPGAVEAPVAGRSGEALARLAAQGGPQGVSTATAG
eukprot:5594396-Alexandrium_andersonii.AAC.1